MPITSLSKQIQDLKDKVQELQEKESDNLDLIEQLREDMDEIVEIVQEHAEQNAEAYQPAKTLDGLPSQPRSGEVDLEEILDTMYKL